jgi:hypothetical protein
MGGWVGGKAGLRIAYSNQKNSKTTCGELFKGVFGHN